MTEREDGEHMIDLIGSVHQTPNTTLTLRVTVITSHFHGAPLSETVHHRNSAKHDPSSIHTRYFNLLSSTLSRPRLMKDLAYLLANMGLLLAPLGIKVDAALTGASKCSVPKCRGSIRLGTFPVEEKCSGCGLWVGATAPVCGSCLKTYAEKVLDACSYCNSRGQKLPSKSTT
ncbi:hypothetical protein PGTUg99_011709 [Puccinia graminis f. sp. tritici]|uniref:Uncharacterized protein n=1 Tax=Puccinia graminis f. sp. tritici TaxID=56615 RepID=A0A5B0P364_PUCGR|nr:hypothetical protein PGTUg99_011709 [Puccinia graminis f. sp. tritici]